MLLGPKKKANIIPLTEFYVKGKKRTENNGSMNFSGIGKEFLQIWERQRRYKKKELSLSKEKETDTSRTTERDKIYN